MFFNLRLETNIVDNIFWKEQRILLFSHENSSLKDCFVNFEMTESEIQLRCTRACGIHTFSAGIQAKNNFGRIQPNPNNSFFTKA